MNKHNANRAMPCCCSGLLADVQRIPIGHIFMCGCVCAGGRYPPLMLLLPNAGSHELAREMLCRAYDPSMSFPPLIKLSGDTGKNLDSILDRIPTFVSPKLVLTRLPGDFHIDCKDHI